jgi:hypothetical protein
LNSPRTIDYRELTHLMTYIKELIELPDRVLRGDFVLRLSEGVTHPRETVDDYVVTPQLVGAFDEALDLIRSSLESKSSKASYLHGSFGSGKSHYMAILHLLLMNDGHARSIPELAAVISKHNAWTVGKKFLLVPYHMIGATDMESAILGGYAEHITRLHPEATTPGVYRADEIFEDAQRLRETMGDSSFFAKLNSSKTGISSGNDWGEIGAGWEALGFDSAINASPKSEDRVRLVGDLVERFFSAARGTKDFVDLDVGLSIISKHAKSLGYDAVILFLDELILWLASHAADVAFVNREGQKLAKLVESQTAERPVPIISFVARQRDLKELVGDQITGATLLSFSDILKWWEARFHKINLEDRNLPAIAERRVLKPKSEAARQQMDDAFRGTDSIREDVMNVLLTSHADREMFRKTYPFSPALMETLIAVSFLLQRERTALKVMQQLLVDQKDTLKLGDIVPVGDLFDAISEGDEAFSDVMKIHFENAKRLYEQKLRPILEREHQLRFEDIESLPPSDTKVVALRNDDRLVKTLLLSALAPNVESLNGLTASRLAALNHGTIKSPIEGRETQIVLQKCRKWAAEVGQIKIGDEPANNPSISVQLTGVDTESIVVQAQAEDNQGNRIRKIKEILFEQLGVEQKDFLLLNHDFLWRATKRSCEILFANIRGLTDSSLNTSGGDWKVIIDFPFDNDGYGPRDDIARLEKYSSDNEKPSRTIAWIPSFLSQQAQRELGTLVKLDHILTGDRFGTYVTHLSLVDRTAARSLLENQRSQLRQRMINYLEGMYGVAPPVQGSVSDTHVLSEAEHFHTLDEGFTVPPPVGASLRDAFDQLLDQALKHQFPAHPHFEKETKLNLPSLRRVYETVSMAAQSAEPRLAVEQPQRKEMRQIANFLKLGEMHETHFVIGHHWKTHFLRKEAEHGGPMTVGKLRAWMDQPALMGLPRDLQNLVIMAVAAQLNRAFFLHGGPSAPAIENLPDELELREQSLPTQSEWETASKRAALIFGVTASPLLSATNVTKLVTDVKAEAVEAKASSDALSEALGRVSHTLSDGALAQRHRTAQAAKTLVDAIKQSTSDQTVSVLVSAEVASSEAAMATSLKKATEVVNALSQTNWELIEAVGRLGGSWANAGKALITKLREAFQKDEYAVALAPVLRDVQSRAVRLLAEAAAPSPATTPPTFQPPAEPSTEPNPSVVVSRGARGDVTTKDLGAVMEEIRKGLESDEDLRLKITWEVYRQ